MSDLTDAEILELRRALPDGGWADKLANRLADEVMRLRACDRIGGRTILELTKEIQYLRGAADNVNCERDMAEAAFKDANAEVERLRAILAREGTASAALRIQVQELQAKLDKAIAALEDARAFLDSLDCEPDSSEDERCNLVMQIDETLKEIGHAETKRD